MELLIVILETFGFMMVQIGLMLVMLEVLKAFKEFKEFKV
jgi:hypothetical protein